MNNSMVAHLWAHEQEESASGSNFFFEGTSIYSYGYHFEVGRIVKNKQGKKAYLINEDYYSATTNKYQCYVRNAIPTWAMVFSVGNNISDTGDMRFVASKLESIKKSIEKYKRAKTELSYTDIWGAFGNMMDYIQFFNMGTAKSILKKSANDWLGTNHELSKSGDSIKRKHVHELKRIFQILLDHQGLKVLGTVNVIVDEVCGEGTWIKYSERSERWRKGEEERERIKLERLRKEEEARYKDFDEKLEEWKSGEINFLNTPFYIPGEKPNAWIRIKGNIIETSKQLKIGVAEKIIKAEDSRKIDIIKRYLSEYEYLLDEMPKRDFKPFERVLVRRTNQERWKLHLFSRESVGDNKYECLGGVGFSQCIPYEGDEHLLGTNKNK